MLSGEFNILKITSVILLLLSISISFANLVNPSQPLANITGAYPVPAIWIGNPTLTAQTRLEANFSLYTANWSSDIVKKYTGWCGEPANPAQNVFYLPEEILPFLNLIFDYSTPDIAFYLEIPLKKEYRNKLLTLSDGNNIPLNPFDLSKLSIDINFPDIGYIYYANENAYLAIGRFPLKWGDAKYPVHISPTTYQDNATLALRFPAMTYTFHAITSYPLLANEEYEIQKSYSDQHTSGRYFYEPSKWIIAHRIDYYNAFGDVNLRLGLGELNIVGGKHLDLIDLNPVLIFHNTYGEGYRNVTGSLDFSLKWKSVFIYGEYVLDDAPAPTEIGYNYKPGACSYDIGGQVNIGEISLWTEYDYVSEWMYVTNYLPYLRINVRHFDLENNPSGRLMFDYPLGFIYGPDAQMLSFGVQGKVYDMKFDLTYNYLTKGLVDDNGNIRWKWFWDSWPYNVSESGSKTPPKAGDETCNILSLRIDWKDFTLLYKTVNFEEYFLSVNYKLIF